MSKTLETIVLIIIYSSAQRTCRLLMEPHRKGDLSCVFALCTRVPKLRF